MAVVQSQFFISSSIDDCLAICRSRTFRITYVTQKQSASRPSHHSWLRLSSRRSLAYREEFVDNIQTPRLGHKHSVASRGIKTLFRPWFTPNGISRFSLSPKGIVPAVTSIFWDSTRIKSKRPRQSNAGPMFLYGINISPANIVNYCRLQREPLLKTAKDMGLSRMHPAAEIHVRRRSRVVRNVWAIHCETT